MSDSKTMVALLIGDVCGRPGCRALFMGLPQLKKEFHADFVVVNGENAANGFGLSAEIMGQFFERGADVITSGNHIWQQDDILPYLDSEPRLLRPANYPPQAPGHGSVVVETGGRKVAVVNLQGRAMMPTLDCPFRVGLDLVEKLRKQTPIVLVDFHAESTEEKEALSFHLDGKASVLVGTHTHVQTADEKILPGGLGYITDLGMSGPRDSVIGSNPAISIQKQQSQMPLRNEILEAPGWLQGVCCTIDVGTGKTRSIVRFSQQFGI